ncbi:PREDICTED: olfactory receptor 8B3-like [Chrysochloris asiatica]|uniref:Olfactory receptor 8B3-like n=1 Tax=Chrysochloris asiatica TaxID=185453 RepID=A0A9B0U076_CHRAS|nr:PREDICTED: olfactory receptor 8B3-like [Chrysochloris asiatica]
MAFILGSWLEKYPEDFYPPQDLLPLKLVKAYSQLNMPGSDLERRARLLLVQLESSEPMETEPQAPAPGPAVGPPPQGEPGLTPTSPSALPEPEEEPASVPPGNLPGAPPPEPALGGVLMRVHAPGFSGGPVFMRNALVWTEQECRVRRQSMYGASLLGMIKRQTSDGRRGCGEAWRHPRFPNMKILAGNDSVVTEFILAGLTDRPELQQPLFYLFLMIYIVTMVGNIGLVILIGLNHHLHTPMYYFLFNLSFIDLCYSSVFTPKMLINFISEKNIISYVGCMTQLFFFLFFVISECYILTSMAYDRYVAICNPLLYKVTMSHQVCSMLTIVAYVMGFVGATAHTGCMLKLTFCKANIINHYLCDIRPLLHLSCTSTYVNEVVVFIVVGINVTVPSFTILISYIFIFISVLHIKSTQGRAKAFSTCSSHIIVILIFFGSAAFMYLKYSSPASMDQGKVSSIFYTNVGPMLNPLIYSLRNKDVKVALRKAFIKIQRRNIL